MLKEIEFFWIRISGIFEMFVEKAPSTQASVKHKIGVTFNDNFPLRGYLSFIGNSSGDEVAITIDVRLVEGVLSIGADVARDDGRIVAAGPTFNREFTNWLSAREPCEQYLKSFENFLSNEYSVISKAISTLE